MQEDELMLARRVEDLRKPDRMTDCLVWLLVGNEIGHPYSARGSTPMRPKEIVKGRWFGSALEKYPEDLEVVASDWRVPTFTVSQDAASMTIPNDVGHVLWNPIGKKPSSSMQISGFWTEYSMGCNTACAVLAAALRARHAMKQLGHAIESQDDLARLETLWR